MRELVKGQDIREVGIELMNTYIRLLDAKPTDSNRARWKTWQPWAEFMEGMGKLKLTMQPAPHTLEDKKRWIEKYVAPTLKMLELADGNLDEHTLKMILEKTVLKPHQIKLVEDYLIGRAEMERGEQDETDE